MSQYIINQIAAASVPNAPSGAFTLFLDTDGIWKKKDEFGNVTPVSNADNDEKVKVTGADTTPGYLQDKLIGTANKISLTIINPGANESYQLNIGNDVFDISVNTSDNITEGVVNFFVTNAEKTLIGTALQPGDNISELNNDVGYITSSFNIGNSDLTTTDFQRTLNLGDRRFNIEGYGTVLSTSVIRYQYSDGANAGLFDYVLNNFGNGLYTNVDHRPGQYVIDNVGNQDGDGGGLILDPTQTALSFYDGIAGQERAFACSPDGLILRDDIIQRGAAYDADYSTNGIAQFGNRWIPDVGYTNQLIESAKIKQKSGVVLKATFTGNPKTATVTFATPFADANYSPIITCEAINRNAYTPIVTNITSAGFTINMTVNNINNLTSVRWVAIKHGEN